jgi:predicted CopG family antitoxin
MYEDLSKELKVAGEPDRAELINAMIQIYKTRIELLERVLGKMEQNNNEKQINQENEDLNI